MAQAVQWRRVGSQMQAQPGQRDALVARMLESLAELPGCRSAANRPGSVYGCSQHRLVVLGSEAHTEVHATVNSRLDDLRS
jgi:hypothetical protein